MAAPAHLAGAPRALTVAAIQLACGWDLEDNLVRAERHVRDAARLGARVILLPELFATPYFCMEQDARHLSLARAPQECEAVQRMRAVARELEVVLPVSFFERAGAAYFNSVAVIDADGAILGVYRKSHIPDGPGYQEKYYFSPGDTGFAVWPTRFARLGVGICWDQWFPECARAMALGGAQLLLYPTAIGSEPPPAPPIDSRDQWMRVQQGHAAANLVPLVAANRCGIEHSLSDPERLKLRFHGSSFMSDETGGIVARAPEEGDAVISATFDLAAIAARRDGWGVFRDRRPDLYGALLTLEGRAPVREPSALPAAEIGGGGGNRTPVRKR